MAQVGIAWVLSKEGVTAPIVGSTSVKHLLDILGTLTFLSYDYKGTNERLSTRRHLCPTH